MLRCVACGVVAGLLAVAAAIGQTSRSRTAAAKMKELRALQQRQQRLASNTGGDEWRTLLRDFELWAKDHGVASETRSSAPQSKCPPGLDPSRRSNHCILDTSRSTAAKCVYRCYRI